MRALIVYSVDGEQIILNADKIILVKQWPLGDPPGTEMGSKVWIEGLPELILKTKPGDILSVLNS